MTHAEYAVVVREVHQKLSWLMICQLSRAVEQVAKNFVVCYVEGLPGDMACSGIPSFARTTVTELHISRMLLDGSGGHT